MNTLQYYISCFTPMNCNKYRGQVAPHKAVMIMATMELVESGQISSNVIHLDKELKDKFKEVWKKVVSEGSPFKCEYRNPFTYMDSEDRRRCHNFSNGQYLLTVFPSDYSENQGEMRIFNIHLS